MKEVPDPKEEARRLGYEIVYKPHREIADYMAFYRMEYNGKEIAPPIAKKFDISKNEIWLSDKLRPYERYILYHELREIEYRSEGYSVEEAHLKAKKDETIWEGDTRWEELRREINLVGEDIVTRLPGFGKVLYQRIVEGRPYHIMDDLEKIRGIGDKRLKTMKNYFWCLS